MPEGSASPSASTRSTARERGERARHVAGDADRVQRQLQRLERELGLVQAQQHLAIQRRKRVRHLVVDRAHHLLGRDAVGHERGDQRAGAGPDVDVELVDRAVGGEQVERPQGTDLVDAAGEPAAAQDQRGARGAPLATCRRVHLDHVAHEVASLNVGARLPPAAGFRTLECRWLASIALIALVAVALAPACRARRGPRRDQRVLAREMARAGAYSGAYVVDLGTGRKLYACKADVARMPASVEKLYTTATALLRLRRRRHAHHLRALGDAAGRDRHDRRQRRPARRRRPDVQHGRDRPRWPRKLADAGLTRIDGPRDRRRVRLRRVPRRRRRRATGSPARSAR